MAFLLPKAYETTFLHIAAVNAGLVHNPVESCTYANDFFLHVLDTGFSAAYILSATG